MQEPNYPESSNNALSLDRPSRVTVSRTGLIFADDTTVDEWERIGRRLAEIDQSTQWAIGDWLLFGEGKFGQVEKSRYDAMLEMLGKRGYKRSTLFDFACVARAFDPSLRNETLSFNHHKTIMAAAEEDRMTWLEQTAEKTKTERVPVRLLRRSIECGRMLSADEMRVTIDDKPVDSHVVHVVGLRNWWRRKQDADWVANASDVQLDAAEFDLRCVEAMLAEIRAEQARREQMQK
jgi:hypothetical protein